MTGNPEVKIDRVENEVPPFADENFAKEQHGKWRGRSRRELKRGNFGAKNAWKSLRFAGNNIRTGPLYQGLPIDYASRFR